MSRLFIGNGIKFGGNTKLATKRRFLVGSGTESELTFTPEGRFIFKISTVNRFMKNRMNSGNEIYIQFGRDRLSGKGIRHSAEVGGVPGRFNLTKGITEGKLEFDITEWLYDILNVLAKPNTRKSEFPKGTLINYYGPLYPANTNNLDHDGVLNMRIFLTLMSGKMNKRRLRRHASLVYDGDVLLEGEYTIGTSFLVNVVEKNSSPGNMDLSYDLESRVINVQFNNTPDRDGVVINRDLTNKNGSNIILYLK